MLSFEFIVRQQMAGNKLTYFYLVDIVNEHWIKITIMFQNITLGHQFLFFLLKALFIHVGSNFILGLALTWCHYGITCPARQQEDMSSKPTKNATLRDDKRCIRSWKFQENWKNSCLTVSFTASTHFFLCSHFFQSGQ